MATTPSPQEQSQSLLQRTQQDRLEAILSFARAFKHRNPRKSLRLAEQAIPLAARLAERPAVLEGFFLAGDCRTAVGDYPTALRYHLQGLQLSEFYENEDERVRALIGVGQAYTHLGEYEQALTYLEESLRSAQSRDSVHHTRKAEEHIATVDMYLGRHEQALARFEELTDELRYSGDWEALSGYSTKVAVTLVDMAAGLLPEQARYLSKAETYFRQAIYYAKRAASPLRELMARVQLAKFFVLSRKLSKAELLNTEVLAQARLLGARREECLCLINIALVQIERGEPENAVEQLELAKCIAEATSSKGDLLSVYEYLGAAHEASGHLERALACQKTLHELSVEMKREGALRRAEVMAATSALEAARREAELHRLRTVELEQRVRERTHELEASQLETLERLALVAEFRSEDSEGHTGRVGDLAAQLGRHLGLPTGETSRLRLAARLHDIGKIAIPDQVLLKPGKLTPEEWSRMQSHATVGAQMLSQSSSSLLKLAEEITRTHHERWDGGGYPRALKGKNIPLSGRIVAVADVFDALLDERPYKKAWPKEKAVLEIQTQAGKQFDPSVVKAFMQVVGTFDTEAYGKR